MCINNTMLVTRNTSPGRCGVRKLAMLLLLLLFCKLICKLICELSCMVCMLCLQRGQLCAVGGSARGRGSL
mgnify:CR=1 FL=1